MTCSRSHCLVEVEPGRNHSFFDWRHTASFLLAHGATCIDRQDWSCCVDIILPTKYTLLACCMNKALCSHPPSQKGSNSEIVMHFFLVKCINSYPNEWQRVVKTAHREMQQLWWSEGWREILKHSEKYVQMVLPRNISKYIGLQWGDN